MKLIPIVFGLTFIIQVSWAQTTLPRKKISSPGKSMSESYPQLSLDFSPTYNLQSEKQVDGSQAKYLYFQASPKVQMARYVLTGYFYFYQNIDDPSDNEWDDSSLSLNRKPWDFGLYFLLTPYFNYGFPLSKKSRESSLLKSTVGTSLAISLNSKNTGYPDVKAAYSLNGTKMFASSNVNSAGDPNIDWRIRQRLSASYEFYDSISFSTRFQFDSAFNTAGEVTNAFLHFEQLEYYFNDYFTAFFGHTNSNGLFNPETYQNNLKLYDNNSSEYYLGLTLSLKNY